VSGGIPRRTSPFRPGLTGWSLPAKPLGQTWLCRREGGLRICSLPISHSSSSQRVRGSGGFPCPHGGGVKPRPRGYGFQTVFHRCGGVISKSSGDFKRGVDQWIKATLEMPLWVSWMRWLVEVLCLAQCRVRVRVSVMYRSSDLSGVFICSGRHNALINRTTA
jgi:hypothetical protein